MSKGQGISINVVIIAALALIILVILALVVSKSSRNLDNNAGVGSCLAQGGKCVTQNQCDTNNGYLMLQDAKGGNFNCADGVDSGQVEVCCRYNYGGDQP